MIKSGLTSKMETDKSKSGIKIILISSGQPTLNPRLVKEADALVEAGYDVEVIYQYWNDWGTVLDQSLLANKKWSYKRIGGSPSAQKTIYFFTRLQHKIAKNLIKYFGSKANFPELAIGRCTSLLIEEAKRNKASLYIAHNLAALPAAVRAAEYHQVKSGFDAEDFHRHEVSDIPTSLEVTLSSFIEDKYLPRIDYLTTASPLISDAYHKLYPNLNPLTILNVFPKQDIKVNNTVHSPLKLFWFSQNIGLERGLEQIIEAMGSLQNNTIELHLLGAINVSTISALKQVMVDKGLNKNTIFFYQPIAASEIFNFAAQFDIGLATEIGSPKNRDLCLTNKVFTYIHAGLAIVASDTSAQKQLMMKFNEMGSIYERNDTNTLVEIFTTYLNNKELLIKHKMKAKTYANDELNWDKEQHKFLMAVNNIIHT